MRYDWRQLDNPDPQPEPPIAALPVNPNPPPAYSAKALAEEADKVASTTEGGRNHQLNKSAFALAGLVAGGYLDYADMVNALTAAAQQAGLPAKEIRDTIASGYRKGREHPRQVRLLAVDDGVSLADLVAPATAQAAPAGRPQAAPGGPVAAPGGPGPAPGTPAPAPAAHQAAANPEGRARTSWWPLTIGQAAANAAAAPTPTHLWREDGACLFYSGKVNGLLGESESGKTWVALKAMADALLGGQRVLMLDFEDSAGGIHDRLRAMGVDDEALKLLDYANPEEALGLAQSEDLAEALREGGYGLIVVDGVNAGMTLLGYDLNSNTDATLFNTKLLRPLARTGACVITVDHVPKNSEQRGKGGIGAQAKRAMMDGCALTVEVVSPFGRGQNGALRLKVDKDRPGRVRGVSGAAVNAGTAKLVSTEDGDVRVRIEAPDLRSHDERGPFRRTAIMEKVSSYLLEHDGATKNEIVAALGGKKDYVSEATATLVQEGHITLREGSGGRVHHDLTKPYTQADDPASDSYRGVADLVGPRVPGGSQVGPGTSRVGGSLGPSPYRGGPTHGPGGPQRVGPDEEVIPEGYENCNRCGQLLPAWSLVKGYCKGCTL